MKKGTGDPVAKLASEILNDPTSSPRELRLAGSALTQAKAPNERTSREVAELASHILGDNSASERAKKLAGSVLAQRKE